MHHPQDLTYLHLPLTLGEKIGVQSDFTFLSPPHQFISIIGSEECAEPTPACFALLQAHTSSPQL